MNEAIERIMNSLGVSIQEAEEIAICDKAIDRGERMPFDLPPELEKEAKKLANSREKKKPTAYQFQQRQRKENPTKGSIIAELAKFLVESSENACENVEIVNKERQISFSIGENKFDLTLIQKRKPKK